jgi:hypothetical protein
MAGAAARGVVGHMRDPAYVDAGGRQGTSPMQNHWWQVPLYLTARGMTTSAMPAGQRTLQIDFDFISHELQLVVSDGRHTRGACPIWPIG